MKVSDKIRALREYRNWSQEDVAERMNMSKSSYSRLEREESKLDVGKLQKLAAIFQIDISDLIKPHDSQGLICLIAENNGSNANYYGSENQMNEMKFERIKQDLIHMQELVSHKDQIIEQQKKQIALLEQLLEAMKKPEASI